MEPETETLPPQTIAGLGELRWEEEGWSELVAFGGRSVRLTLLCDVKQPNDEEKLAVLNQADRAQEQLAQLREVEPAWRLRAAQEIAQAAGEQFSEDIVQENLRRAEVFASALVLDEIVLHGSGALYYHDTSGEFPPDETITIFFSEDVSYEDVE